MVKRLLFVMLSAGIVISCATDNLDEAILSDLDSSDGPIAEIVPELTTEEEKNLALSNFDKTSNWMDQMQQSNGLLETSEGSDFVSLYDNSLAALVYISKNDLDKAEHIFDFFESKIETELTNGTGGFYQYRNRDGENGGRTWLGDNAWLLIAINNYHKAAGNQKYQALAKELEKWIRSMQDIDGGIWGGYREDGSQIHKITEGIITSFNAVEGYDDFHKNILQYLKKNRWDAAENVLVAWPTNPKYNHALDLHSLAYNILKDYPETVLENADRYINEQVATVTGEEITGYCFDEDKDVVWLEGTAQMAVAYQHAGNFSKADALLYELEKTFIASASLEDAKGIPYAANRGSSFGAELLWERADISAALSSTAWYIFAKMNFNPFEIEGEKNILAADKFWIQAMN